MKDLGIFNKVNQALAASEHDAIIIAGPDNVRYLSGALLPFQHNRPGHPVVVVWPKGGEPLCISPAEWVTTVRETGRIGRVESYAATGDDMAAAIECIAAGLDEMDLTQSQLGCDLREMSQAFWQKLEEAVPQATLTSGDALLSRARMVKTETEVELLTHIAALTDHGINAALHHVIVDHYKTSLTLAEEIRVHCMERGLSVSGYHAVVQAANGEDVAKFWTNPPLYGFSTTQALRANQMVRVEARTTLQGYWSDAARLMTMGEPTADQRAAYAQLVTVRDIAREHLQPGVRCGEAFEAIWDAANAAGIGLHPQLNLGHGVGVSPSEAPYLRADDETELEPGMVLVLDPVIKTDAGLILRSKDTLVITEDGHRLVGWYKDWREPYIPIASI